jgi:bifunctional non-homologous end joining protein LigD
MEPARIEPCIPTLVKTPPIGADWNHEIKHDGYRTISVIDRGTAQIFNRRSHDWSSACLTSRPSSGASRSSPP